MVDRARGLELEFDDDFLSSFPPDQDAEIHCSVTTGWEWRSTVARDIDASNGVEQFVHPSVRARQGSYPGPRWAAGDYAQAEERACALPTVPLTPQEEASQQRRLKDAKNARQQALANQHIKTLKKKKPTISIIKPRTGGLGSKGKGGTPPKPAG
jgi:hypothetical protein